MEPACAYCRLGRQGEDESVICPKQGVRQPWQHCWAFQYDPLRRIPEAAPAPKLNAAPEDFRL